MAAQPSMEKRPEDPATLSFTGGARVGWFNATWPFARLTADTRILRLSVLGMAFVFTPDSALELAMVRGFFTPGLQIRHGQSAYAKRIIFWWFNPAVLKAGLEGLGWTVS